MLVLLIISREVFILYVFLFNCYSIFTGYYIGLGLFAPELDLFNIDELSIIWSAGLLFSLVLPGCVLVLAIYWHINNCDNHPISKELTHLAGENGTWRTVASSINVEFRRIDKFVSGTHSRLVAVTDSWIIKTSTYYVYIAHQNDIHLTLSDSEEHPLSYQNQMAVQYLNITVGRIEPGLKPFTIRYVVKSLPFSSHFKLIDPKLFQTALHPTPHP